MRKDRTVVEVEMLHGVVVDCGVEQLRFLTLGKLVKRGVLILEKVLVFPIGPTARVLKAAEIAPAIAVSPHCARFKVIGAGVEQHRLKHIRDHAVLQHLHFVRVHPLAVLAVHFRIRDRAKLFAALARSREIVGRQLFSHRFVSHSLPPCSSC